jgi:hypothetical protein
VGREFEPLTLSLEVQKEYAFDIDPYRRYLLWRTE